MISSNNVYHPGRVEVRTRPIALHRSALTPEEYDYYMAALTDLSLQNSDQASQEQMERMDSSTDLLHELNVVTLREARAWLRGRFHSVPCVMVDEILRLFPSPLTGEKTLTGAEFLAALRLICHAQNGMTELDRNLTFKPASIAVAISPGTIHPAKGASHDEIAVTSPVNQSKNADVDISALCQAPFKRNERYNASTAVVAATPNRTGLATRPKITAATKAPLRKLVPEKRAIEVESEDDDDSNVSVDEKSKKNAKPAQESQTEARSQGTGSPAKKARRTNAGKRKSDATWDRAAAKSNGPAASKEAPSTTPAPIVANKPTTATTATAPSIGPNLAQLTTKKPFRYATAAPVPMPHNTRMIKPAPLSQFALRTKKLKLQEEGKEESDSDPLDSYSVPKPRARFGPKVASNSATKPSSKLKSDEPSQDSDSDPNKTESDSSSSGDSDSDPEKKTVQKPKMPPNRLAATARGTKKPTSRTIKPATRSTRTVRSKKVKGKQTASDGFSRPPPNKDGAYLIDRITASHTSPTGAVELNVVWEGYPESESTWEPLAGMKETEAYARWAAMWARLGKKGIKDVQMVTNRKNVLMVDGRKREHRLIQAVGTNVNKARWVPVEEAQEMMSKIKKAILEDEHMMAGRG